MNKKTYLSSLQESLNNIFENDSNVVILGEDILDPYGGAFKVTKGLSSKFPDRVITTPICEASIVGVGTGLALRGIRAITEIMFGDFLAVAADQIINEAAKLELISRGHSKVPLVIRTPVGAGRGYGPVHSQSLEKIFFGIPGLNVVAPSHYHNPGKELYSSVYCDTPVIFLENKLLYPARMQESTVIVEDNGHEIVRVKNFDEKIPADVLVIAYGGVSRIIQDLMQELSEEEIRVSAVLPSLISPASPLLLDCLAEEAAQCGRVVIVEEGYKSFGWGQEIACRLYEKLFNKLLAPIKCVSGDFSIIPSCSSLEQEVIVNKSKIESAIMETLS